MEEKKPFAAQLEAFFAGKGFYIVLFLCIAVIGVSAWSILAGSVTTGDEFLPDVAVASMDGSTVQAQTEIGAMQELIPPATAAPVLLEPTAEPEVDPAAVRPQPASAAVEEPAAVQERDYFIWPVGGTVENPYSMTALTFNRTMQDWRTHDGIDVSAELGTPVKACANGRVAEIREDDLLGTTVVLSHRDGLVSIYANLAATPTVSVGDQVGVGQTIGAVGDTALCETGEVCHLHFAMSLDGESVDPTEYLP